MCLEVRTRFPERSSRSVLGFDMRIGQRGLCRKSSTSSLDTILYSTSGMCFISLILWLHIMLICLL